ncbi:MULTISPECIES: flagellar filament capping protein FliD [unclassified Simplicispira]|uniref:flagellar filament capping protein FliD n=1 Tax=unclassified Simplicispira TaxID=2630407 RepID=UPI000D5CBE59|nr:MULTISPECIES: flagellar filament capping protein FliD [unclassified Simplicispira]PVY56966.1 flagellar hook-associated protein 2 [Simplicispira sp. 125]REG17911.1 flagellar hook-associated protein 2 [Simplicispira sp. 110]
MAISSAGIGSGLDVESIVSQLVTLEKRPIVQLQTTAASIQTKLSTYSQVKSLMSTLSDAAAKLTRDGSWNGMTVSSANSAAVSATVTGIASATTLGISVQQLARAQTVASSPVAKDTPMGAGTMTIQLGTWLHTTPPPSFTPGTDSPLKVTVGAGDSLSTIASKINDANGGVTATVLSDATGDRLLVRSKATGETSGFRIQVEEDSGTPGLSGLAFDPENSAGIGMAANAAQYAQNTLAKINGIDITSANNTFANTIPGLSITVSQVSVDEVGMTVGADTASMKKNIQDFVDAYNAVNDLLSSSVKYDAEKKTAGALQGDNTAVGLQNALRMLTMGSSSGAGVFQRLSDVGISMQSGGKLSVDGSKMDAALKNPVALKSLFATAAAGASGGGGIAVQFKSFTSGLLSLDGLMNNKTDALESASKRNIAEQNKVNDRASVYEKRLRAQYSALDAKMGSLSALNSYISQQVSQWNKSNG